MSARGIDAPVEPAAQLLDAAGKTWRARLAVGLAGMQMALEVFDFYVIGFLVAEISVSWKLTYGQTSVVLLAAGLGAIIGSLLFGELADRIGRKPVFVGSALALGAAAAAVAVIPEGNWQLFALLRVVLGACYAGAGVAQITFVSEIAPLDRRILYGGLLQMCPPLGLLCGALTGAVVLSTIGWRWFAAIGGLLPVVVAVLQLFLSPESIRWQLASGRRRQAQQSLEKLLGRPIEALPDAGQVTETRREKLRLRALLGYPREFAAILLAFFGGAVAVNGVLLWGPTIVSNLLQIGADRVAAIFILVSVADLAGRVMFTWLPKRTGRRRAVEVMGYGGAAMLAVGAFGHDAFVIGVPVFLVAIIGGFFFFSGGYANMQPYVPELFPTRLAATGTALSQIAGGTGKMLTPVFIALIAGPNKLISPATTVQVVLPGMLCLALGALVIGLSFTFLIGARPQGRLEVGSRPALIGDRSEI